VDEDCHCYQHCSVRRLRYVTDTSLSFIAGVVFGVRYKKLMSRLLVSIKAYWL